MTCAKDASLKENPNHWLAISLNHIMGPETPELYMAEFLLSIFSGFGK